MCGIADFIDRSAVRRSDMDNIAGSMTGSSQRRGPEDAGVWADSEADVAFGHRRLSIVDLSAAGHQPMVSHDGRYVITFNGEVYAYAALRAELQPRAVSFIGHSDTEVLVESIAAYGVFRLRSGCAALYGTGRRRCSTSGDCGRRVLSMPCASAHCGRNISTGVEITSTCFGIS